MAGSPSKMLQQQKNYYPSRWNQPHRLCNVIQRRYCQV